MTCARPADALLFCTIDPTTIKNQLFTITYTDLLLNQFNIRSDFDRLVQEIGISTPEQYNFLLICDSISSTVLHKKLLPYGNNIHIVSGETIQHKYDGKLQRKDPKRLKILKKPNYKAFHIKEIHAFDNESAKLIIIFINFYKTFFIERLLKDNDRRDIFRIEIILNSLIEFPFVYTLENPFRILLCNTITDDHITCNYCPIDVQARKKTQQSTDSSASEQEQHSINICAADIINDVPAPIDHHSTVYILDFTDVQGILHTNTQLYRIFKMFYYTYCFHDAKWFVHPNNRDNETLYIFRKYFNDEIQIISHQWPESETISVPFGKLRQWCPHIFGEIHDWFFRCDIKKLFSATGTDMRLSLPHMCSRPLAIGGHVWKPSTLAAMALVRIGVGTTSVWHVGPACENNGKDETVGYYKHLFSMEYDSHF